MIGSLPEFINLPNCQILSARTFKNQNESSSLQININQKRNGAKKLQYNNYKPQDKTQLLNNFQKYQKLIEKDQQPIIQRITKTEVKSLDNKKNSTSIQTPKLLHKHQMLRSIARVTEIQKIKNETFFDISIEKIAKQLQQCQQKAKINYKIYPNNHLSNLEIAKDQFEDWQKDLQQKQKRIINEKMQQHRHALNQNQINKKTKSGIHRLRTKSFETSRNQSKILNQNSLASQNDSQISRRKLLSKIFKIITPPSAQSDLMAAKTLRHKSYHR